MCLFHKSRATASERAMVRVNRESNVALTKDLSLAEGYILLVNQAHHAVRVDTWYWLCEVLTLLIYDVNQLHSLTRPSDASRRFSEVWLREA